MSEQRLRVMLAIVGLALIVLSVMAFFCARWPSESEFLRDDIEPTLFVPPQ